MTAKTSISLPDDLNDFAKGLVESGRFPSVSAVVQFGLDRMREEIMDDAAERVALRELLTRRAQGTFITVDEMLRRLEARRSA
jgi:antitoxin ParD1/3/4